MKQNTIYVDVRNLDNDENFSTDGQTIFLMSFKDEVPTKLNVFSLDKDKVKLLEYIKILKKEFSNLESAILGKEVAEETVEDILEKDSSNDLKKRLRDVFGTY